MSDGRVSVAPGTSNSVKSWASNEAEDNGTEMVSAANRVIAATQPADVDFIFFFSVFSVFFSWLFIIFSIMFFLLVVPFVSHLRFPRRLSGRGGGARPASPRIRGERSSTGSVSCEIEPSKRRALACSACGGASLLPQSGQKSTRAVWPITTRAVR